MSNTSLFILRGVDEVTSVLNNVQKGLDDTTKKVDATAKATMSGADAAKNIAVGFSGLATAGVTLYNTIDRIQTSQVALEKAHIVVARATETMEKAQTTYNKVVEKYGINSKEAKDAADALKIAQDSLAVANDRVSLAQGNVNQAMVATALMVVPSIITAISGVSKITSSWKAITEGASSALMFLQANPLVLVATGIAVLVAGLIYAYNNCEPFRNAVNAIATVLGGALSLAITSVYNGLKYLWDNILVPLGNFLGGAFLTAWNALADGISYVYNNILKPVFDALKDVWDYVIKPIADTIGAIVGAVTGFFGGIGGGGTPSNQNLNVGGHLQEGGVIMRPMFALLGEAGPEAVIPLNKITQVIPIREMSNAGGVMIEINGPLISIAGSVDRQTAEYAVQLVMSRLRSVIVEATSASGPASMKRIRPSGVRF